MLLRALVESSARFSDLPPVGYEEADIKWVLDFDSLGERVDLLGPYDRATLRKRVPTRGDRSGTVSEDNLKPALFVDRASYVFGLKDKGEIDTETREHQGFLDLLETASLETAEQEAAELLQFLRDQWTAVPGSSETESLTRLRDRVRGEMKPKDMIALRSGGQVFPFEQPSASSFWLNHLEKVCCEGMGFCAICGVSRALVRILPWQVAFFGYSCPISSFNRPAFDSFGKNQTGNSPMCFRCASTASQLLQYLVKDPHRSAVLAKDESKGEGKAPLRNQLAVFWLKYEARLAATHSGRTISLQDALKSPLDPNAALAPPPAEIGQMKSLLSIPWSPERAALKLDDNSFYLAVLSPNKSRLVVREWVEESVVTVIEKMSAFVDASSITDSDGTDVVFGTIPRMLEALKPLKSRSTGIDTNLARGLLRTAYRGLPPPPELLDLAVQRFRVPDRPANPKEEDDLKGRRTVLAAAMKLVITYGQQEAITLQELNTSGRNSAYISGQLLAILEEAQGRSARWKINSTLVDRYYGAASTAPGSVLGQLLNQSTKSHMPKIRKEGWGYDALEELLENALGQLDDHGGFPNTLTLGAQAEFALGFYHQRAKFRASRPKSKAPSEAQQDGGQAK
jgi:CRISPR-associated protein Csd1